MVGVREAQIVSDIDKRLAEKSWPGKDFIIKSLKIRVLCVEEGLLCASKRIHAPGCEDLSSFPSPILVLGMCLTCSLASFFFLLEISLVDLSLNRFFGLVDTVNEEFLAPLCWKIFSFGHRLLLLTKSTRSSLVPLFRRKWFFRNRLPSHALLKGFLPYWTMGPFF